MDGHRFDGLTRTLAGGTSRRQVLKLLAGGVAGGLAGVLGAGNSGAAPRCKRVGQRCHTNADCCPEQNQTICSATSGQCEACPAGTALCGGQCVAGCTGGLVLDPTTCTCSCPPGTRGCGGTCVDIMSDEQHCGGCGGACTVPGSVCAAGQCACPLGTTYCHETGSCADLGTDPANCGSCGNACPSGACAGGACACAPEATACGGQCVGPCAVGEVLFRSSCTCGACPASLGTCATAGECQERAQAYDTCQNGCCCTSAGSTMVGCVPNQPAATCCSGMCGSDGRCA